MDSVKKEMCFFVTVKSELMPFVVRSMKMSDVEKADLKMQKFVRLIEKKFDSLWYIGTDYFETGIYERFMFHHGGFLEISMNGELKAYFTKDKSAKFILALKYAVEKMNGGKSSILLSDVKKGQRLISLADSINAGGKE